MLHNPALVTFTVFFLLLMSAAVVVAGLVMGDMNLVRTGGTGVFVFGVVIGLILRRRSRKRAKI